MQIPGTQRPLEALHAVRRDPPRGGQVLLLAAVLLVALNLRGAIAAVAPVLPQIRSDLSLSATTAGLLTTLPVVCFAAVAPVAAWLARRFGVQRAVLAACLAIGLGTLVRPLDGPTLLLLATLAIGVAMAVGNVLVPVVVKRDFPGTAGRVTGLYTAALTGGAALTAAVTAPVAGWVGWRAALAGWALLAVLAAVLWQATGRARRAPGDSDAAATGARHQEGGAPRVWRDRTAWAVSLLLGFQSVAYYATTAWLPTLLLERAGVSAPAAGVGMSLFQGLGLAGTLLVPLLVGRRPGQSWLAVVVAAGWATMFAGLLLWPAGWVAWTMVGGVAQGSGISFTFTVLVLRAHDAATTRGVSAMAQLVGYTLAATAPVVVGALAEATAGWDGPLLLLLADAGCWAAAGLYAGRPRTIRGR